MAAIVVTNAILVTTWIVVNHNRKIATTVQSEPSKPMPPTIDIAKSEFQEGYNKGKELGLDAGSHGLQMPLPQGMQFMAAGSFKANGHGDPETWESGFKIGYEDGFAEAERPYRPITAERSYWAGYKAGHASAHIPLSDRLAMHKRCDEEIAANRYDKGNYDEGFRAGTADADKQQPNWR